jgi:hypothetical protein
MWTAECLFTDRLHAAPLSARSGHHTSPVRLHPSQTPVTRFADDIDRQKHQKKASENDPEEQLGGDQLLKEISVKRN